LTPRYRRVGVATLYLITAVPTFTAKAVLIVNSEATLVHAAAVPTVLESQIGIIKSESIASAVIEKLGPAKDRSDATTILACACGESRHRGVASFEASSPKPGIVLGIAIVGGLFLGIGIAMLRDLLDRGIRASGLEHRLIPSLHQSELMM
jgi:uncharacterized protein involved in exopolysaccharide biosynthesis